MKGDFLNSTISANSSHTVSPAASTVCTTSQASPLRALLLSAGAFGFGLLSVWIWMLGSEDGRFVLLDMGVIAATLPTPLVFAAAAGAGLGVAGFIWALLRDERLRGTLAWCVTWGKRHPALAILITAIAAFGAIDFYELFVDAEARRYNRNEGIGLRKYMIREDLKVWLLLASTLMTALAISAAKPWCANCAVRVNALRTSLQNPSATRRWLLAAFLVPAVLGSLMSLLALDGVPHFSDSLTYQMQGRMLYNGQLAMDKPAHPDLFIHSLFFVTDGQHIDPATNQMVYEGTKFFGKYPIGWPAVLGFFDKLGVGFTANAVLAGLGALLTFGLARQVTTRRVAVIAAMLFALSPWAWFNGSHFASHVASMVAVNGFLCFFLRVLHAKPQAAYGAAVGAGLCLGGALLVRPFDAAMFSLPAIIVSFALVLREPKKWITHGAVISLATCVGIAIYLASNAMTTGHAKVSPYSLEGRWAADWDTTIASIVHRFQFQWAEMNGRFPGNGLGGLTLAAIGAIIAWQRGLFHRSIALYVILACNLLFFAANTPFLFTNVWWGPRWLLPVTPLLALLVAEFVAMIMAQCGKGPRAKGQGPKDSESLPTSTSHFSDGPRPLALGPSASAPAAQLGMLILFASTFVGLAVEYAGRWYVHRIAPPHNVSSAAHDRAREMKLTNVVIGMPTTGSGRAPLDARAGMVFMKAPFESNAVIYVRKVDNWAAKAKETFPGRQLYELIADKEAVGGFVIKAVGNAMSN